MTLVAGFRCMNGGVLLCADREENDGFSKREVDKIHELKRQQGIIFIAGAGPSHILQKFEIACAQLIHEHANLLSEHVKLLEDSLDTTYQNYVKQPDDEIACMIVIAPHLPNRPPLMYKTVGVTLAEKPLYGAVGTGELIANYLSDRLYKHPMDNVSLGTLAAFVLRETEESTSGVGGGLGFDIAFIHDKGQRRRYITKDPVKELQSCIPRLGDVVWPYWKQYVKVPKWLEQ